MEPTMIKVSIAKLWSSIQEVEVPMGSTVMTALKKAGYNLDWVVSVKRNGAVAPMDSAVAADDVLLVSLDKIKGGLTDQEMNDPSLLKVAFTIEKEDQVKPDGLMAFTDDMSTFEIVKQVMHQRGVSLNNFKEIRDAEGNVVTFADKLEDGKSYKIIVTDSQPEDEETNDEY